MYVRCTESKTLCFEVGGIYTVDHLTGDELNTQYIKDDHGDAWRLEDYCEVVFILALTH